MNRAYIERQRECFVIGLQPPDYPKTESEATWVGRATVDDVFDGGKVVK